MITTHVVVRALENRAPFLPSGPDAALTDRWPTVVEVQPGVGRSRVQGTSGALRQSAEDLQRSNNSVCMLLLARRLCDVLGLVSPFFGGTRSRAVVTLCTVSCGRGRWLWHTGLFGDRTRARSRQSICRAPLPLATRGARSSRPCARDGCSPPPSGRRVAAARTTA